MEIEFSKSAIKFLKSAPKHERNRILQAIDGLTHTPQTGDIKRLLGTSTECYRLRIGKYRVIFRYDENGYATVLCIMDIGSRGDIYK